MIILFSAIGGGLGAVGRFLLGKLIMTMVEKAQLSIRFPIAMMIINVVGSFLLGLLFGLLPNIERNPSYFIIGFGFLSGFTTFSTFSVEALELLQKGRTKEACLYVFITITGSIFMYSIGLILSYT
ncbi:fluoride efflux transporter CrcB [Metabacillus arenae]|uniref:Fluoride-specific ion channel FluC n=1 Tax=Metabacillus arenae TaxID=2771434 RepID=A0A926NGE5_9BACI|nr:fluoride efflux transporter CrcB [Metabacillus arenae]MBD1380325.1 fluoride efflux transporter CrcB [Metabacillus arenae]